VRHLRRARMTPLPPPPGSLILVSDLVPRPLAGQGQRDPSRMVMSNAQAIAEVWEFFDTDGKGYIESEGLAEALAARLTAVEPHNLKARNALHHRLSWSCRDPGMSRQHGQHVRHE